MPVVFKAPPLPVLFTVAEAPPMTRICVCCEVNFTCEWSEFHARMKRVSSKCSSVQLRANSAIYSRKSHLVWMHSNRPLRSLGSSQLEITRVHTKQGESAFSYYATHSWNQLPEEIRGPFFVRRLFHLRWFERFQIF